MDERVYATPGDVEEVGNGPLTPVRGRGNVGAPLTPSPDRPITLDVSGTLGRLPSCPVLFTAGSEAPAKCLIKS